MIRYPHSLTTFTRTKKNKIANEEELGPKCMTYRDSQETGETEAFQTATYTCTSPPGLELRAERETRIFFPGRAHTYIFLSSRERWGTL